MMTKKEFLRMVEMAIAPDIEMKKANTGMYTYNEPYGFVLLTSVEHCFPPHHPSLPKKQHIVLQCVRFCNDFNKGGWDNLYTAYDKYLKWLKEWKIKNQMIGGNQ
jgi:hypothetical protein